MTDRQYTGHIHYYSDDLPRNLVNLAQKRSVKHILDLGCGDGAILFALKKRGLLKSKDVSAVDIAEERIAKVKKIDKKFHCWVADACKLDKVIPPKSVNLVISSQVIEHLVDQKAFIGQVRRVLRSKGYFYLSTVFKKWYGWYFYRNAKGQWALDPTHLREYQREEDLLPLLEKSGFKIIKTKRIFWRFPLTDFFLKRFGFEPDIYQKSRFWRNLRVVRLPIIGYYYWEIICQKSLKK